MQKKLRGRFAVSISTVKEWEKVVSILIKKGCYWYEDDRHIHESYFWCHNDSVIFVHADKRIVHYELSNVKKSIHIYTPNEFYKFFNGYTWIRRIVICGRT